MVDDNGRMMYGTSDRRRGEAGQSVLARAVDLSRTTE